MEDMVPPDPLRRAQIEKLTGKIDRDQGSQFFSDCEILPKRTSEDQDHASKSAKQDATGYGTPRRAWTELPDMPKNFHGKRLHLVTIQWDFRRFRAADIAQKA
ncbi:hypothetical protein Lal_00046561 [Lupinus albus]|nr:hypothetical protein Lal_00046561 [Lupinus albus]